MSWTGPTQRLVIGFEVMRKRQVGIRKWSAPILFFAVTLLGASCSSRGPQASSEVPDRPGKTAQEARTDAQGQIADGNPSGSHRTGGGSSSRSSNRTTGASGAGKSSVGAGSLIGGDGEVVAFNRACDNAECDASASETKIHRIRADGSDDRHLVQGVAPSWSRDGKRIALATHYWGGRLRVMNSDGSDLRDLNPFGAFPRWSPDGLKLTFNWKCESANWPTYPRACWQYTETPKAYGCGPADCGIGMIGADGSGLRRLGNGIGPDWGPDGRIVFTDGTPTEPCQYGTAYWYEENTWYEENGGASHDYESAYRLPACALPLWVMNADGSGRTTLPIAKATAPKWSPDGKRIAYHVETEGVFISNADGTGSMKVAPAGFMDPSWSSDGKRLALTRRTSDSFTWSTFVRAVDGSGEKQLTFGARDTLPSYSPHR
jgi:hypothetical protein